MHFIYLFFCLAVITVLARPEPPVFMGLQQQNQRALPLNAHALEPHIYQQLPDAHSFANFATTSALYGSPFTDTSSSTSSKNTAAAEIPQEDSYKAAYRHSSTQHHQTGYEKRPTETQVHKHIYVHVPPKDFEDDDAIQPRVTHQGGPKQKHYKIVFIKAPTAPEMRKPIAPPPPQSEEKTLIYVLHKKPETQADIVIPTPEPTKPSKPEVYFIKYKHNKDESPVYGAPPSPNEVTSRQAVHDNTNNPFRPMDFGEYQAITSTHHPQYQEEEQQPNFTGEEPDLVGAELYNSPTNTNYINEEVQSTTTEPLNQYLSPETTLAPIVVKEMEESIHVPVSSYGAPKHDRFFIKRRK